MGQKRGPCQLSRCLLQERERRSFQGGCHIDPYFLVSVWHQLGYLTSLSVTMIVLRDSAGSEETRSQLLAQVSVSEAAVLAASVSVHTHRGPLESETQDTEPRPCCHLSPVARSCFHTFLTQTSIHPQSGLQKTRLWVSRCLSYPFLVVGTGSEGATVHYQPLGPESLLVQS